MMELKEIEAVLYHSGLGKYELTDDMRLKVCRSLAIDLHNHWLEMATEYKAQIKEME